MIFLERGQDRSAESDGQTARNSTTLLKTLTPEPLPKPKLSNTKQIMRAGTH